MEHNEEREDGYLRDFLSEDYLRKPIDPSNGKPRLTLEDMRRFIVLSDLEYKHCVLTTYEYSHGNELFSTKGDYLATCVARRFNLSPNILIPAVEGLAPIQHLISRIPRSFSGLVALLSYKLTDDDDKKLRIAQDVDRILNWLSMFSIYPEFESYYAEYLLDTDDCVQILPPNTEEAITSDPVPPSANFPGFSIADLKVSVHMLAICMNKTLEVQAQFPVFLEKRLKAVQANLRLTTSVLFYNPEMLKGVSTRFNLLPKLKSTIFRFLYFNRNRYTELENAVTLMAYSAMTTINLIGLFLTSTPKTLAHRHPIILEEATVYLKTVNTLKERTRTMWPYYRFLYPEDGTINASAYPNLGVAAVYYAKKFKSATFANYNTNEGQVTVSRLQYLTETEDDQSLYKDSVHTLTEGPHNELALRAIGLDIRAASRVQREPENYSEDIANLLRSLRRRD